MDSKRSLIYIHIMMNKYSAIYKWMMQVTLDDAGYILLTCIIIYICMSNNNLFYYFVFIFITKKVHSL